MQKLNISIIVNTKLGNILILFGDFSSLKQFILYEIKKYGSFEEHLWKLKTFGNSQSQNYTNCKIIFFHFLYNYV